VKLERGKNNQRSQLLVAIGAARQVGGILLIAKLDRSIRNVGFILVLHDLEGQFACGDMPDANAFTVSLVAVIA
jgi:hypothetical protein